MINFCAFRLASFMLVLRMTECSQSSQTLQEGATGCEVTKEAINQISASDIFTKQDHFLYPRVGLVSKFGTSKSVHDADGIWQTTKDNLKDAKKVVKKMSLRDAIKSKLCFDFEQLSQDDMKKPLVSITCAALLLEKRSSEVPKKKYYEKQCKFWAKTADISRSSWVGSCESAAKKLDKKGTLNDGADCFRCQIPPTDLVFVLDESTSISSGDYEVQKRICEKVIEAFHSSMHSSQTQVAMIFYGRRVYENDGYMSSYSAALDYLKLRQKENEQGTRTDLALEATKQLIQDSSRYQSGVRQAVFFLTDGRSQEPVDDAAKDLHTLDPAIYAIGVSRKVDEYELEVIASRPDYWRHYDNMADVEADIEAIKDDMCRLEMGQATLPTCPPSTTLQATTSSTTSSTDSPTTSATTSATTTTTTAPPTTTTTTTTPPPTTTTTTTTPLPTTTTTTTTTSPTTTTTTTTPPPTTTTTTTTPPPTTTTTTPLPTTTTTTTTPSPTTTTTTTTPPPTTTTTSTTPPPTTTTTTTTPPPTTTTTSTTPPPTTTTTTTTSPPTTTTTSTTPPPTTTTTTSTLPPTTTTTTTTPSPTTTTTTTSPPTTTTTTTTPPPTTMTTTTSPPTTTTTTTTPPPTTTTTTTTPPPMTTTTTTTSPPTTTRTATTPSPTTTTTATPPPTTATTTTAKESSTTLGGGFGGTPPPAQTSPPFSANPIGPTTTSLIGPGASGGSNDYDYADTPDHPKEFQQQMMFASAAIFTTYLPVWITSFVCVFTIFIAYYKFRRIAVV